jgi:hypothetical protein
MHVVTIEDVYARHVTRAAFHDRLLESHLRLARGQSQIT